MKYEIRDIKDERVLNLNKLISLVFLYNKLDKEAIDDILSPLKPLRYSNDECILRAKERILRAKADKEKIFIAGDYDADGICATTIIKDLLDRLEIESGYYIPNRITEGYGLSLKRCKEAIDKGYNLIITVDNGVKANEALEYAKSRGIDVIVSDHHIIEGDVDAYVLVHPDKMSKEFKGMCGSGVALEISRSLIGENDFHTCLAAIATMGDVMDLIQENRSIVRHGLEILNSQKYDAFNFLLSNQKNVTSKDISFKMVPKLNALGRLQDMANPNNIIRYFFLAKNKIELNKMKENIASINMQRQKISRAIYDSIASHVSDEKIIVEKNKNFHEGVVGLVAGRLSSEYKRPSLVFSEKDSLVKGSGRSIDSFDLYEFLKDNFLDYFVSFGGHSQAVGLSLKSEDYDKFLLDLNNKISTYNLEPSDKVVYKLDIKDLNIKDIKALFKLEPFGQAFKIPEFILEDFEVVDFKLLKNLYPKYLISDGTSSIEAISFDTKTNIIEKPKRLIGEISINKFLGQENIQFIIKDME